MIWLLFLVPIGILFIIALFIDYRNKGEKQDMERFSNVEGKQPIEVSHEHDQQQPFL
ncbi:hypothetical protein LC087_00530 [Bacillus carboniphilus]|uniref:Uncharacterized protein n=1 Tax=Bacillus carboniphilus TaxID=86663 RepID=A0ABY9JTQ7_9BACI|nr:hypothetical protein [Bacillus carboniphilus]WLR42769.1 hypothetical protein LC087_00530 [Bacillus carboniphilus]